MDRCQIGENFDTVEEFQARCLFVRIHVAVDGCFSLLAEKASRTSDRGRQ